MTDMYIVKECRSNDLPETQCVKEILSGRGLNDSGQQAAESDTLTTEAALYMNAKGTTIRCIISSNECTGVKTTSRRSTTSTIMEQVTIPGGQGCDERNMLLQRILVQATQQASPISSKVAKTSKVTTGTSSIINSLPKRKCGAKTTVQSGRAQSDSDRQGKASGKSKSETVLYAESKGMEIRCNNDECTRRSTSNANTSIMQQPITPGKDGNNEGS